MNEKDGGKQRISILLVDLSHHLFEGFRVVEDGVELLHLIRT